VNDILEPDDAATPLTPEEMRDLIPAHIAYRSELNEAEQENIARAQEWALAATARSAERKIRQGAAPAHARRRVATGRPLPNQSAEHGD